MFGKSSKRCSKTMLSMFGNRRCQSICRSANVTNLENDVLNCESIQVQFPEEWRAFCSARWARRNSSSLDFDHIRPYPADLKFSHMKHLLMKLRFAGRILDFFWAPKIKIKHFFRDQNDPNKNTDFSRENSKSYKKYFYFVFFSFMLVKKKVLEISFCMSTVILDSVSGTVLEHQNHGKNTQTYFFVSEKKNRIVKMEIWVVFL